ncbi:hypothetical protein VTK26DRAFT_7977 [Humicola hyalothermophila]
MYQSILQRTARVGPLTRFNTARSLTQLTMGFTDIQQWKEHKRKQAEFKSTGANRSAIFDLKIYTPINKSNTWNISYAPDAESKANTMNPSTKALLPCCVHNPNITAAVKTPARASRIPRDIGKLDAVHQVGQYQGYSDKVAAGRMVAVTHWRGSNEGGLPRGITDSLGVPGLEILSKLHTQAASEAPGGFASGTTAEVHSSAGAMPSSFPGLFTDAATEAKPQSAPQKSSLSPGNPSAMADNKEQKDSKTQNRNNSPDATGQPTNASAPSTAAAPAARDPKDTPTPQEQSETAGQDAQEKVPKIPRTLPLFLGGGPFT